MNPTVINQTSEEEDILERFFDIECLRIPRSDNVNSEDIEVLKQFGNVTKQMEGCYQVKLP